MGVKVKPDRKKPGRWWVRINHQGKRKSVAFSSKKAADIAAVRIDAALKLGRLDVLAPQTPAVSVQTYKDYAEKWLTTVGAVRLRLSTVEQYRTRLRVRINPALGHLPLTSITRETVRTALAEMIRVGNLRTPEKGVARATMREAVTTLRTILATAVEDGLIPVNPCARMRRQIGNTGGQEAREVEVFTREELARLLAVAERDYPAWHPFILCLARTGMRLGEAVALQWADVDFEQRVILVRRSERKGRVSEPKSGKARRVEMSRQLMAVLRSYKTLQEAEAALRGEATPERVFVAPAGRPVADDTFRNNVWAPILRRAELRYRKPHTLRHTYASLLIEAGEPLTYVQQQLGHHSPTITLKVYAHLLPRGDRRAVDGLDDAPGAAITHDDVQAGRNHESDALTEGEQCPLVTDASGQCGQFRTGRCI
jgi:integrase